MKIFHELVVDDFVADGNLHWSRIQWSPVLGNFETMRFFVVADHVSGSPNPVLNVVLQETPNVTDTIAAALPAPTNNLITNASLTPGQTAMLQAAIGPSDPNPTSYANWVAYALTGTAPFAARIRIWVTGRGRA